MEQRIEKRFRDRVINQIYEMFLASGEDVHYISNNELCFPVVDEDGNEAYATIKVSIPRGKRNKETGNFIPYNGYEAIQEWEREVTEAEAEAKAKAEAKAIEEREKERRRKARTKKIKSETSE